MSTVESMRYGTPFLATPFGGGTDLISNNTGLLSNGFSKENIYDLLIKSYENKNLFDPEKIKEKVIDLTKENMDKELINFWKETN